MLHLSAQTIWLIIGFLGQGLFFMRFLVQWIASEREGKSIIPVAFWYFSIFGGLTLLCYSLWRQDPVFIMGQSLGIIIYSRNLFFIRREIRQKKATTGGDQ